MVSGITDDQGAEHGSNTSSGSGDTDGGGSSTNRLGGGGRDEGGLVDGRADRSSGSQGQTGVDSRVMACILKNQIIYTSQNK